ncbi:MAG: aspartate-semialdehyde dehydrogenase [Kiritimatiellae bacterium]|nr:aspartate-semialdehyde dehydrogenase [Kiritimatiellia bacterium]MCO5060452.1 aspartate-semialdehyde dehydrogenase [Kiritimatiellia bacterium]MCO5068049.1 aspartate-semialdehyde dehydrogenase [Kiritimatiellia bacterium]MCO6400245.1 aspartate-semialdehyde dehydrogenase [Verrucomicrobiota bacterium]
MKQYNVCVVGIGAVGTEMVRLLKKRHFPMKSLTILARSERIEEIDGDPIQVKVASPEAFEGMDFAFFAGTEGAKGASQTLGWEAVKRGCVVIDNGDDFRMDSRVPLVIPEINPEALREHQGLIANPNCSTIIALMPLAALHKAAKIKRIVASTYQAVSGTGAAAVKELEAQVKAWATGEPLPREVYPHQIAFNVLPSVGSFKDDSGESTEEIKMRKETHKILGDSSIRVGNTCVRVPVVNGHSIAMNIEFEKPLTPEQAREILKHTPGVRVVDDPKQAQYPMPLDASGNYEVLVGRIRKDQSSDNGLVLWCAGDNIWKGAAQNAIQIAETLIASENAKG